MLSGTITEDEFTRTLKAVKSTCVRLALLRNEDRWRLHTLIIDVLPYMESQRPLAYDYGTCAILHMTLTGEELARWCEFKLGLLDLDVVADNAFTHTSNHVETITAQDGSGRAFPFELSLSPGVVSWMRYPSYTGYDFSRFRWPCTRYDLHISSSSHGQRSNPDFLIAPACPFYPDFQTAVLDLVYGAKDAGRNPGIMLSEAALVRIADTEAWIDEVHVSPTSLAVNVTGSNLNGVRLEISGPGDFRPFDGPVEQSKTVTASLPDGLPADLWIILSRGTEWLDYRHFDRRWSPFSGHEGNVTFEPPDLETRIQEIVVQGEGPTTEFKEAVPDDHDQMLKTVAAFANGEGGVILIGVCDENGEIKGVKQNPAKERDRITDMIRKVVVPEPGIRIESCEIDHRSIIAVYVESGTNRPYGLHADRPQYYIRRGATTFPARQDEIRDLVLATGATISSLGLS